MTQASRRFGIAAVILLVLAPRRWLRLSRRDVRRGLIIGVFLGSGFLAQTTGLQQTSAAVSGFLTGLMVVLTPIVAAILFQERIAARGWVAVVVATVGLAPGLQDKSQTGGAYCQVEHRHPVIRPSGR